MRYVLSDPAPIGVPDGVLLHFSISVTDTAATLGELLVAAGAEIPHWWSDGEEKWPRSVLIGPAEADKTVVVTLDGQDPTVTPLLGLPVLSGNMVRLPYPSGIRGNTIKLITAAADSPAVLAVTFEA